MLTVVLEANLAAVELAVCALTTQVQFKAVGRLTAIQSPLLEEMGEQKIRNLAATLRLPVRAIVDRPPFHSEHKPEPIDASVVVLDDRAALPPSRG